ncbi:MAG: hypothetical protein COT34_01750 [Candidatus Nealsonbacteria bacterium CG08_land_8_20_14_0_20_43_11]|uniref:4-vinyl reductase 4VR domain-containing protein n=1 Tax=Candidatus Nealsonbacteria bacterium CG08_land_8_20_14_0_20_43_11 TaxID=1974706 RepID=A0A2M6T0W1_9BACT|nr:MAG: hypothetical protein COT34_01750 [Candidatus Nealsonbacteria bacterium CG08_land_8_20_14_0_20_43_11]
MKNTPSLTKKQADELISFPCKTRGEEIYELAQIIKGHYGEEGMKKIEKKLADLGYPVKLEQIKMTDWYPEGLNVLVILIAQEIFGWSEEEVFTLGQQTPQFSFGAKLYIKYLSSPEKTFAFSPGYWHRFVTCGEIEAAEFNETKRSAVFRLKDYKFHPVMCQYFRGYFLAIARNALKSEKITMEETACMFKGAPYHEYTVHW